MDRITIKKSDKMSDIGDVIKSIPFTALSISSLSFVFLLIQRRLSQAIRIEIKRMRLGLSFAEQFMAFQIKIS